MNQENSSFVKIDLDAKRRQALAKVYGLLIHLADKSENQTIIPEPHGEEIRKIDELALERTEIINKDVYSQIELDFSNITEQSNNSVPLKSNIPS